MNKFISKLTVILTAASFLFAGCTRDVSSKPDKNPELPSNSQASASSHIMENSSQEGGSSVPANSGDWQMESEYLKIEPSNKPNRLYGLGIMPGHVLLGSSASDAQTFCTALDYNLGNDTWKEIGNYNDTFSNFSALESYLYIDNKVYFNRDDYIACIDIARQEISQPAAFAFVPTSASLEAIDDHSFVLYLLDVDFSREKPYQYHIYLFDVQQNRYREILTDLAESKDTAINGVSASNGMIYLYCTSEENGTTHKIMICSPEGNVQQEIILDDLKGRLQQASEVAENFYALGDCFFFKTSGSGSRYLYAYEDGSLHLIDLPSDSLTLDEQRGDNLRDREENPYYYFWDNSAKVLYPFNCQTKTFSSLPFGAAGDENLSIGIWDDAEGNLLMSQYRRGQDIPDYYYIPQSTILKYME